MPEDGYYGPDIISLGKMMAEQYQDQFVDITTECPTTSISYLNNLVSKSLRTQCQQYRHYRVSQPQYNKF